MANSDANNDLMEKIVSLAKQRGFVFPGSEIYGGLANSWDYGPLGTELKNNIKQEWWRRFVQKRLDVIGLDSAIIMNPKVWEASGHVDGFNDPLVEDVKTHKRYRADHLLEDATGKSVEGMSLEEMGELIEKEGIKSPDGNDLTPPKSFNLLFKTELGATEGDKSVAYLRGETAQGIFVNFLNLLQTSRKRLPFGVAQIGKAFRNEITTGNFVFRTREFEQMEIEYFINEKDWEKYFDMWLDEIKVWLDDLGITEGIHFEEIPDDERAHYSKRTVDVEYEFPFGQKELYGLAYRTDYDLSRHQEHSGQDLVYTDPETGEKFTPHVIEPSMGVDRTVLATLLAAYDEEEVKGEKRTVLRLPAWVAPVKVAILPLSKKDELKKVAEPIFNELSDHFTCEYDETQSIGKRYRRQDEIGTPYCITVDFESLEDKAVTVRDRDTMEQERVEIDSLSEYLTKKLNNK